MTKKTIVSWNVAGIRAAFKKNGLVGLPVNADIICFQETKCEENQVTNLIDAHPEFPFKYFHSTQGRKGLHGTSIWSRREPIEVTRGLPNGVDEEGRVITCEFDEFNLVTVYTPNSRGDLSRLVYRTTVWDPAFRNYVTTLKDIKPTIVCGDLNVCHKDIDVFDPSLRNSCPGLMDSERYQFDLLLRSGFKDTYRKNNETNGFTFWPYNVKPARELNLGWRLDYFLVSYDIDNCNTYALPKVTGSDHCPVVLECN